MINVLTIIIYILILIVAFLLGFIFSNIMKKTKDYSGILKVIRDENKVLYSLEFDEDPIILQHMSEVVFRVDTSDQSSDRK